MFINIQPPTYLLKENSAHNAICNFLGTWSRERIVQSVLETYLQIPSMTSPLIDLIYPHGIDEITYQLSIKLLFIFIMF